MQGKPSVVASSHQEKHHHSPASVAIHIGEHRGGLPQRTQTAEVGLQTDLIRVLEGLPHISSLAHTRCLHIQRESSDSQVHDLGARLQGNGNQHLGFLLRSCNLIVPFGPSLSYSTGEGLTAADHGDSDLSGVDRSNVVVLAGQTEDRIGSNILPTAADYLKFHKGSKEELPNLDPLYAFHISRKVV